MKFKLIEEFNHKVYRRLRHKRNRKHILIPVLLTVAVLMVLIFVLELVNESFRYSTGSAIVFASFAASAFILFMTPYARSSSVKRFVKSYVIAGIFGELGYLLTGIAGFYVASAFTLFFVALLLFETDSVHSPAMALAFAFVIYQVDYTGLFVIIIGVVLLSAIKLVIERLGINP